MTKEESTMNETKNILVPTDFSEYSDKALKKAIELAKKFNSKIYLLHVIDQAMQQCVVDYCIDAEIVEQLEKNSEEASEEMLQKEVNAISEAKGVDIIFDVKKGRPYETILNEQKDKGIDLIVIASHGRTGLKKHLMGSVAEKVARGATCPVMLVR
jgi:nucleotide-binding universal stress UspA family protein